jgi:hypothetical protein
VCRQVTFAPAEVIARAMRQIGRVTTAIHHDLFAVRKRSAESEVSGLALLKKHTENRNIVMITIAELAVRS